MKRDYYEVLGVSKHADARQIKTAYRKLAQEHHPDKNQGDAASEERFKEAAEAYEVLSDQNKRARYDQFGHAGLGGAGGDPFGGFGGQGFGSVSDIFGDIFGDVFGGRGGRGQARRGADLRYNLELSFEEAAFGCKQEIVVPRHQRCETCGGSGAKPGSSPVRCTTCGGAGGGALLPGVLRGQPYLSRLPGSRRADRRPLPVAARATGSSCGRASCR